MSKLVNEPRSAARSLWRSPTIKLSAVLCLALGIGATTAASAIARTLLDAPPVRDPAQLGAVHRITPQSGPDGTWPQSAPNCVDLPWETRQLEGLSALTSGSSLISLTDGVVKVRRVSGDRRAVSHARCAS
jgi:hypothetical protein